MSSNTPLSTLNQAIQARQEELIDLTIELIAIPTINPPGDHYLLICEYLEKRLVSRGFEVKKTSSQGRTRRQ